MNQIIMIFKIYSPPSHYSDVPIDCKCRLPASKDGQFHSDRRYKEGLFTITYVITTPQVGL